jgi:hypothetical protein
VAAAATPDESHFGVRLSSSSGGGVEVENPHSALLRDRLRQRCAHRAQQARTKRVERERRRNALSSDGEDLSMGSDEDDDDDQEEIMLNDEVGFCAASNAGLVCLIRAFIPLPAVS